MKDYLIDFNNINWESHAPGVRYKEYTRDNQKIRLVEFTDEFKEKDWCLKGHIGYVMEGGITMDFSGTLVCFKAGEGFIIPGGEKDRHKGIIMKGEKVKIIMFEKA